MAVFNKFMVTLSYFDNNKFNTKQFCGMKQKLPVNVTLLNKSHNMYKIWLNILNYSLKQIIEQLEQYI